MRILVVEDEKALSDALCEILKRDKYSVDAAYDGMNGLDMGQSGIYDAIILDIMLPKMNGIDVLLKLRAQGVKTPVLLLTARDGVKDKVKGLDSGAEYNNVEVYISFLRKKLGFIGSKVKIKAVRGIGYTLEGQND